jgi:hypothetical protein
MANCEARSCGHVETDSVRGGVERDGTVAVFDSKTGSENPAAKRRKNTLAEHHEIRLRQR